MVLSREPDGPKGDLLTMSNGPVGSPSNSNSAGPVAAPGATTFTPDQLALLPHNNAGPKLTGLMWAMCAVAAVFIALRIYCKISRGNKLWWDDHVLIASWVRFPPLVFAHCAFSVAGSPRSPVPLTR